jgi:hypothetical protein
MGMEVSFGVERPGAQGGGVYITVRDSALTRDA